MRRVFAIIINFLGGSVRYIYGTVWRTILNKKRFTFNEYINGIKDSDSWYDSAGHAFVNYIIGVIVFVLLIWFLTKF